ncbi:MAG: type II secretion system protein [Candidatus Staskawiczbacteria bacterium]|nr:type II secretion system protein [Candidatus Staskawiczbacteria bacterium]
MNLNFKFQISNSEKGFTIIELIVSTTVFLLVVGIAVAIFISIVQHQRGVLADQELLNQISYVEEYMSKALRMAKTDTEGSCIQAGGIYSLTRPITLKGVSLYGGIKFINQSDGDSCQEFFLDNTTDPEHPVLKELKNSANDSNAVALTSSFLQINSVRFGVNGTTGCNGIGDACPEGAFQGFGGQPRVTVLLNISLKTSDQNSARIIQTTVSQRNISPN